MILHLIPFENIDLILDKSNMCKNYLNGMNTTAKVTTDDGTVYDDSLYFEYSYNTEIEVEFSVTDTEINTISTAKFANYTLNYDMGKI